MHWENLEPLIGNWPLVLAALLVLFAVGASTAWIIGKPRRQHAERVRRYWLGELRWRARLKSLSVLNRIRTPRLTDQRDRRD